MTPTSTRRDRALGAILLAGTLATAAQAPSLTGGGFSPTDDPDSPYFRGEVTPPSRQGRPSVIPESGGLVLPESLPRETL